MSKKREVLDIDFTGENHHVALVSKAANGESVLLMKNKVELQKAEEVKITTSMQAFLQTFFGMWEEDAQELAELLGYEPQEWYWDVIGEDTTVEIMKAAADDPSENLIHKDTYENLKKSRIEFNKLKKAFDSKQAKESKMGENVDLQKSIDDAVQAALKKEREKYTEIEKSLKEKDLELTELKKAKEQKEKEDLVDLCKGYSFVDDAEKLAETLYLCKSVETSGIILDTLEKARKAIKASLEKEIGTDEEKDLDPKEIPDNLTKTAELIKNMRKEVK